MGDCHQIFIRVLFPFNKEKCVQYLAAFFFQHTARTGNHLAEHTVFRKIVDASRTSAPQIICAIDNLANACHDCRSGAHRQGSSVTYNTHPSRRLRPNTSAARRSAKTSACAVGSPRLLAFITSLRNNCSSAGNNCAHRNFSRKLCFFCKLKRTPHHLLMHQPRSLPRKNSATVPGPEWLPMTGPTRLSTIFSGLLQIP